MSCPDSTSPPPSGLGPIEGYAPWSPVAGCFSPQKGTIAFRDWALKTWGGSDLGIARDCGIGDASKHHEGRAWDWAPPNKDVADEAIAMLLATDAAGNANALARRLGIRTMIWWKKIWVAGQGWKPYTGKSPHTDHVHFGFGWPGAKGQTSGYVNDGKAVSAALMG